MSIVWDPGWDPISDEGGGYMDSMMVYKCTIIIFGRLYFFSCRRK